jgi:uncharacterized integral membrane protein (TIGR00698 family)
MKRPQWAPKRSDVAGLGLAAGVALLAMGLSALLPKSPYLSDILLALVLGATVLNTPLHKLLGLAAPSEDREADRYASGLRFTGKWVLRLGIILMGLKVRTEVFGSKEIELILLTAVVALPTTFMLAHTVGSLLGVRRPLVDLVAGGTMICGASAVNAIAPVAGARRNEQGIAIGTVFLFSLFALVVFRPVAVMLGLDVELAGLWSGLAVNDLSSAIAVGQQMGPDGGVAAAAAKSARVVMLAPTLVILALMRSKLGVKSVKKSALETLPRYLAGYVAFIGLRMVLDRLFPANAAIATVYGANARVIEFLLLTVAASIGLHLELKQLLGPSVRAVLVGAMASFWMAGLTLGMLWLVTERGLSQASLLATFAFGFTVVGYRFAGGPEAQRKQVLDRFSLGAPLTLTEAIRVLDAFEAEGTTDDARRQLLRQLHPSIGELIPVRESPLPHGEGCRWVTYWEGASGWALVAVCREPGSSTPIHAHPHRMLGKSLEGALEELRFDELGPQEVRLADRRVLGHNELVQTEGLQNLHVVRVVGEGSTIDVQLRGPEVGQPGRRLKTQVPVDFGTLAPGSTLSVIAEVDDRPGHGGEGAKAGRVDSAA